MTTYRIIYPTDDDGVAVVVPAPGIEQTEALKAVPAGKPYLVVDVADIPTDRLFRDAWTADFTDAQIKE
jgi:hypothetical protein